MTDAAQVLNQVLHRTGSQTHSWNAVAHALIETSHTRSDKAESVLRDIAQCEAPFDIEQTESNQQMSPSELLRTKALLILCRWDINQHKDIIDKASNSKSPVVANFARLQCGY